ncbi:MAG: Crp/Fnr family transcriptional regulator [Acidobacteriota bacterium]|jgi:CRP/FNR family transcriptional regulator|nr:Crp/Fnr family transcriptional regulator [Acidobacteriota bacterium]
MDIYKTLDNARFFDGISKSNKAALAEFCLPMERPKHTLLFHEGDSGDAMFLLARGRISLYKLSPDGVRTVIEVLKPGDVFAEVILFEQRTYPVTATAMTDILIFRLARRDLLTLLHDEAFRNDFIAMLLGKQRHLVNRLHQLAGTDVEQRLRAFLLEHYGDGTRFHRIHAEINKKQLAAAIGATPETLSRLLQDLGRRELLTWKQGVIEIAPAFWQEN